MKSWKSKKAPFRSYKRQVFKNASLVCDFIYQIGEYPELRESSKEVPISKITSLEMQVKFKYLKKCLLKYRKLTGMGRGITAVQVGIPERFSVVYTPEELILIVNPKVTKISKEKLIYPEVCMSANPIIAPTIRPSWIEFDYYDEKGNFKHWDNKDKLLNRVLQHEIDHMDGIINIDRCSSKDLILESDPKFYQQAKFEEITRT